MQITKKLSWFISTVLLISTIVPFRFSYARGGSNQNIPPLQQAQEPLIADENFIEYIKEQSRIMRPFLKDTDGDGVPDIWEQKTGYTGVDGEIVKWHASLSSKGYEEYRSNKLLSHTVGDQYSDGEKAVGRMDKTVKREAKNPLVAAVALSRADLKEVVILNKRNISIEKGNSTSLSATSSLTSSNTSEVGGSISSNVDVSLFHFNFGLRATVDTKYSTTQTSTAEIKHDWGKNWSNHIGLDTSEAAYLNPLVTYLNTGTATSYEEGPTVNMLLDGKSITTVKGKENQLGDVKPGGTYPERPHAPISFNQSDTFGSRFIPLAYSQIEKIMDGKKFELQTTGVNGLYGTIDKQGNLYVNQSQKWGPIIMQIQSRSARIILDTGKELLERYVAAKDGRDPNDLTPELTLKKAVQIAVAAEQRDGRMYYKDMALDEEYVDLTLDQPTAEEIGAQLKSKPENERNIYDVKIRRDMNITIKRSKNIHPTLKDENGKPIRYGEAYTMKPFSKRNPLTEQVIFEPEATKFAHSLSGDGVRIANPIGTRKWYLSPNPDDNDGSVAFRNWETGHSHWIPIDVGGHYFAFKNVSSGSWLELIGDFGFTSSNTVSSKAKWSFKKKKIVGETTS